jgi:hypothetical protein
VQRQRLPCQLRRFRRIPGTSVLPFASAPNSTQIRQSYNAQ